MKSLASHFMFQEWIRNSESASILAMVKTPPNEFVWRDTHFALGVGRGVKHAYNIVCLLIKTPKLTCCTDILKMLSNFNNIIIWQNRLYIVYTYVCMYVCECLCVCVCTNNRDINLTWLCVCAIIILLVCMRVCMCVAIEICRPRVHHTLCTCALDAATVLGKGRQPHTNSIIKFWMCIAKAQNQSSRPAGRDKTTGGRIHVGSVR